VCPLDPMYSPPGVSTGYEPKPGASASLYGKPLRREKVSDDLIKVLPPFSYEMVQRKKFGQEFCSMIKLIGGVWMIKNRPRKNPAHNPHKGVNSAAGVPTCFISPKHDRNAKATQDVAAAGVAAYPPHETKYVVGRHPMPSPVVGTAGVRPYANLQRTQRPGQVPGHCPSHGYAPWLTPSAPGYVPGQRSTVPGYVPGLPPRQGQAPWRMFQDGPDQVSGSTSSSGRSDASQRQRPRTNYRRAPRVEVQHGSPLRHVRDVSDEDRQLDMREQLARQRDQRFQQLEQQMADQQAQIADLGTGKVGGDPDTCTSQGAEDWIVDAAIEASFSVPYLWWHEKEQRWEDDWETMLRARVYSYLIGLLPKDFWQDGVENDIRFVYGNILNLNRESSDEQVVTLHTKVLSFSKGGRSMKGWMDAFDTVGRVPCTACTCVARHCPHSHPVISKER
jgi:hypothetical protein